MRKTIATTTMALMLGVLSGCSFGEDQIPAPTPIDLSGEWIFVGGVDPAGEFSDKTGSMSPVTFEDGNISGRICNQFGGSFKVQGGIVTVGAIMSTEMYCEKPEGLMDLESRFLVDLTSVTGINMDETGLHLTVSDSTSLNFEKAETN